MVVKGDARRILNPLTQPKEYPRVGCHPRYKMVSAPLAGRLWVLGLWLWQLCQGLRFVEFPKEGDFFFEPLKPSLKLAVILLKIGKAGVIQGWLEFQVPPLEHP